MDSIIDEIQAKSLLVKDKRKLLLSKLKDLEKSLTDSIGDISIFAQGKMVDLEIYGDGDCVYGYLFYSNGELKIAYRNTEDDCIESQVSLSTDDKEYTFKNVGDTQIDWLEKLSSEESITLLLRSVGKKLDTIYETSNNSIMSLEKILASQSNAVFEDTKKDLKEFSEKNLYHDWQKARQQVFIEPSDSITRTSSYLESVCKKILHDLSVPLPVKSDITNLIKSVSNVIELSGNAEADPILKQLFGGIKGVFQAIGALRTHFGTAHGRSPQFHKIDENCARLANDAAAAVSVFIIKRFKQKLETRQ